MTTPKKPRSRCENLFEGELKPARETNQTRGRKSTPNERAPSKPRRLAKAAKDAANERDLTNGGIATASKVLSQYFNLRRRYARSVNLERDLANPESLAGYVPTERAMELLERIVAALRSPHAVRAWTVTGVYGTGKSACAHFLAALYGPKDDPAHGKALAILEANHGTQVLVKSVCNVVGERGLLRAIATARREPLSHTVVRALARGAEMYWEGRVGRKPAVVERLRRLHEAVLAGELVAAPDLPEIAAELAEASTTGVLLIVDELGKTLEHAARGGDLDDLFLLQQLAELPAGPAHRPVLVIGLLHQTFAEYASGLSANRRGEWDKVQGRFEDIVFVEAPEQTLRLVAAAIEAAPPLPLAKAIGDFAAEWQSHIAATVGHPYVSEVLTAERIASVYPLHPLAALALPTLCAKFAQNERSLFTFLTSQEPHAFARFLAETTVSVGVRESAGTLRLPVLKLPDVYDYLIDVGGGALAARPQFQRWTEVRDVVRDAIGIPTDELAALKTIGTLNLITSSGPIRASRAMVLAALIDCPDVTEDAVRWTHALNQLIARRLVTYRRQVDEFRLWEGSDYDIDGALAARLDADRRSVATVLSDAIPIAPMVAERHSYRTGTLRFFECHYVDSIEAMHQLAARNADSDGVVAYWVTNTPLTDVPAYTTDGKPLAVVPTTQFATLASTGSLVSGLATLLREDTALKTDGVARKEVRQRLAIAREALESAMDEAFASKGQRSVWLLGEQQTIVRLNTAVSMLCERAYPKSPVLWNELINRRELTSQGARAQRELLEALVTKWDRPRLGLEGNGPEVSMYNSMLYRTGIHREGETPDAPWTVEPPGASGLATLWSAIEAFCLSATDAPRTLDKLYLELQAPPYGVKRGVIPVILAAVLVYHADDVSLYRDGTFVAALGAEQFELLVKQPHRFSVKHFGLTGVRWEVFRELETVLTRPTAPLPASLRNRTLLNVVRPLVRFATALPNVTKRTSALSPEGLAVRDALLSANEPDELVFTNLPRACGIEPFLPSTDKREMRRVVAFRRALLKALSELQAHYDRVLELGAERLRNALAVPADHADLREHLRVRAQYLLGQVVERRLRSFTTAAADGTRETRPWLESLLMIAADRPVENWTDDDMIALDVNLADLGRRFGNLEALQKDIVRDRRDGFDARRVTITRPDGTEQRRLVWTAPTERMLIAHQVDKLVAELQTISGYQRHAVAFALVERLLELDGAAPDNVASHHPAHSKEEIQSTIITNPGGVTRTRKVNG